MSDEPILEPGAEAPAVEVARPRHFRRTRAALAPIARLCRRLPHPSLSSRRGLFVLFLLVAGFGSLATVGGVMAVHYTETASFCGRCHTMGPELNAYAMSPHRELACAECHVEPGVGGWVKAKANGTKQLFQVITGSFPRPIPPPDHSDLPAVTDTCLKCHALDDITKSGGPVKLVLRARYQADEKNTRELVAVVLRPAGLGQPSATDASGDGGTARGVHWHVQKQVTYRSTDVQAQHIDLVKIAEPDGTTRTFIAGSKVTVSTGVDRDVTRIERDERARVMDCLDCHNRVGHAVPSTGQAVDESITSGRISLALPYIKRDAVALLDADYPTFAAADKAIEGLRNRYSSKYPLVARTETVQLNQAIEEIKRDYRLVATPAMKVQAKTYPDNLGHLNAPGCFRCHDGAHYLVVKGKVTNTTIPSTCATCHTFPQIGVDVSGVLMGGQPVSHQVKDFVFSHKNIATSLDPGGTSCGSCHVRNYCVNCHSSGAVKVKHDQMLYSHPAAVRVSGLQACSYCHQTNYCATCHKNPLIPAKPPDGDS
jgi:nitrate/TMAO reductase-like tetraheme cytochrome c subunit